MNQCSCLPRKSPSTGICAHVTRQRQFHTGVIDSKVFRNNLWEEKTFKSEKLLLNVLLGIFSENLKKKVNYSIIVLEPLRQF